MNEGFLLKKTCSRGTSTALKIDTAWLFSDGASDDTVVTADGFLLPYDCVWSTDAGSQPDKPCSVVMSNKHKSRLYGVRCTVVRVMRTYKLLSIVYAHAARTRHSHP